MTCFGELAYFAHIDGQMQAVIISHLKTLLPNQQGILEPKHNLPLLTQPEICITPGIAFTASGHRLGWGEGHYDRYFTAHPTTLKIALAYDFQVLPKLPISKHDKMVDLIITEKRIIQCSR